MDGIKHTNGFTLIETLLYIVLASAISVVLFQAIDLMRNIRSRHIAAAEVNGQAEWAMRFIGEKIQSGAVTAPAAGGSSDRVSFGDGHLLLVEDGRFIDRWATDAMPFSGSAVAVSDTVFENLGNGAFDIIRVTFTARYNGTASTSDDFQYSRTYETSITPLQ